MFIVCLKTPQSRTEPSGFKIGTTSAVHSANRTGFMTPSSNFSFHLFPLKQTVPGRPGQNRGTASWLTCKVDLTPFMVPSLSRKTSRYLSRTSHKRPFSNWKMSRWISLSHCCPIRLGPEPSTTIIGSRRIAFRKRQEQRLYSQPSNIPLY